MTLTTDRRPSTPLAIVLVRICVAVQLLAGLAATALLGLVGALALGFAASDDEDTLGIATIFLGLLAVCIFLLVALGRSLAGLRRADRREYLVLMTIEGILVGTLTLMLALTNSFGTGSLGDLATIPVVVIGTGLAVLLLLAHPSARAWTSER